MLTDDQIERFSRHILLPEVGGRGQQRLLASAVLVVGDGVAAECCAAYLEAAGVGRVVWRGKAEPLFLKAPLADAEGPFALAIELGARGPEGVPAIRASVWGEWVTVVRGSCADCRELAVPHSSLGDRPELGAVAGSLAATEALLALLEVEGLGDRVLELDLACGTARQRVAPRCATCEGRMENPS